VSEFVLLSWDCETGFSSFRLLLFNLQVSNPYFVLVFSDCLCFVLNLISWVNGRINCEFSSFSFGFHVLLFGNLFKRDFFILFGPDFSVQTGDCMRTFSSDDFGCQVQRQVMDCSGSLDCHLSSFVSSYRLILIRAGGSRHDSQHDSELPRAEEKVKESTEGTSKHRVEIDSSTECILRESFSVRISLTDVVFASNCHLREIDGFDRCISLP
jgi:hypothetical protein